VRTARPGFAGAAQLTLLGAVLVLSMAFAPAARAQLTPQGPASSGDFAGSVALPDCRRLYLECHGSGGPTVVFEAGLRSRSDIWTWSVEGGLGSGVFPQVSGFTRACIYDRPGTLLGLDALSRSDPVPMPRSTGEIVTDLHDLLRVAGVPGPYVMVGSSTGGLIAREYASRYPSEAAGMVLVDAISEAVQNQMTPRQFARYDLYYLQSPAPQISAYEDLERIDFYRSFAELRLSPRPPHRMPIVVLSKQIGFFAPNGVTARFARFVNRVWKRAQEKLALLEPGVRHLTAVGSGHQINVRKPGLVARMIGQVVTAVRQGRVAFHRRG
jgi:pimeloyl-ACP methyl ester carboxylesterase